MLIIKNYFLFVKFVFYLVGYLILKEMNKIKWLGFGLVIF